MTRDYFPFLRRVALFADLADVDLMQICESVEEIYLDAGDLLFLEGDIGQQAYVIEEGQIEIYKTVNGANVQLAVRQPGEVIGEISLLEETPRNASGAAVEKSLVIAISRDQLDNLLNTSPRAVRAMLHTIILRLQQTEASLRQNEKMAQLGTFTAGIAHEISNPSAAVQRGAEQLKKNLDLVQSLALDPRLKLGQDEYSEGYHALRIEITGRAINLPVIAAGTRFDRESALETWLDEKGVEESWDLAPELVGLGYDENSLAEVVARFPPESLPVLLHWMVAEAETRRLVEEIHQGARRVTDIIKALKSYVYLDQAPRQQVDLHEGLENTLVILRHKLKQGVEIVREYDPAIPPVMAYGSELNQVWTNLIDNAIDALDGKGRILLRTRLQDSQVIVEIEDNGPGIPPEVRQKLFYPFFTTKPVGKGTGLGLNISYQIIQKHGGDIQVFSQPGQTRFEIRLPLEENRLIK